MTSFLVLLSFVVSVWLTRKLALPCAKFVVLDQPNQRSLHKVPVPRTGGVGIIGGIVAAGTVMTSLSRPSSPAIWISMGASLVAIISFVEDYHKLSACLRILIHLVAGSMVVLGCFSVNSLELGNWRIVLPEPLASILTLLFVVWFINLYNFMDGMDGFAGGMTVIGFGIYAILGWQSDGQSFALLSAVICAAALGFVLFNFPPAKIFMGDTGSTTLGFLVASFTLWANQEEIFPLWIGVLVFSPFVIDATLTLLRRLIKGGRFWQPHRSHYYQRLVLAGWGHRRTVLWEYALMVGCALSAFIAVRVPIRWHWVIMAAWGTVYGGLVYFMSRIHSKQRPKVSHW